MPVLIIFWFPFVFAEETSQHDKACLYKPFPGIDTPSLITSDLYIPFQNYYRGFSLVSASKSALFIRSCVSPCYSEYEYFIVNLKDGSVISLPEKIFPEIFYQNIPEVHLLEEGPIVKLSIFSIKEVLEDGAVIIENSIRFDFNKKVITPSARLLEKISINDDNGYLKELLSAKARGDYIYTKYWTDGIRFIIASYGTYKDKEPLLRILFGKKGGSLFKKELPNPTDTELLMAYGDDFLEFCGNDVDAISFHKGRLIFGIGFYGGEGCKSLGGIGSLDFNTGKATFYRPEFLAKWSTQKILPLEEGSLFIIPIWHGEGDSGRWEGPWVYYPESNKWKEFTGIRENEVILDADKNEDSLWVATDRKLYRFNLTKSDSPHIYGFSEDAKKLVRIDEKTITESLKGSESQRRWAIFWLSEEPYSALKGELLKLLKEDDKEIRKLALRGIGKAKVAEAFPIIKKMKKDKDLSSFVIFSLYCIGGDEVRETLESYCLEKDKSDCDESIQALRCMKGGVSSLRKLLTQINEPYLLSSIIYYLGEVKDKEAVPLLLNLASQIKGDKSKEENPFYWVNQSIIEALYMIKDERAVGWLKKEYRENPDVQLRLKILDAMAPILQTKDVPYLKEIRTETEDGDILYKIDRLLEELGEK